MLEKLESLEEKYEELNHKLSDPEIIGDPNAYTKLARPMRNWRRSSQNSGATRVSSRTWRKPGPCLGKTRIKSL